MKFYRRPRIVYDSKLAAFLGVVAFTFGRTIRIKKAFLSPHLLRHELQHVEQHVRYGLVGFFLRNAWYNLIRGYDRNPLEIEARAAEIP